MINKLLFSITLLLFFFTKGQSQELVFDSTGLIISSPPSKLESKLTVLIPVNVSLIDSQATVIKNRFDYLEKIIRRNGQTEEMESAKRNLTDVLVYFEDHSDFFKKSKCAVYKDYLDIYCKKKHLMGDLVSKNRSKVKVAPLLKTCDSLCICIHSAKRLKELINSIKALEDIYQREELIRKLLCDRGDSLYMAELLDSSNRILLYKTEKHDNILPLGRDTMLHPTISFGNNYLVNGANNFLIENYNRKYHYTKKLEFKNEPIAKIKLQITDLFKKTILEWHNKTVKALDTSQVKMIEESVKQTRRNLDLVLKAYSECSSECTKAKLDSLNKIISALTPYEAVWSCSNTIGLWLTSWLWFSGGDFKLNYLNFSSEGTSISKAEEEAEAQLLADLTEVKNKIQQLKNCISCSILSLDTLYILQRRMLDISGKLKLVSDVKEKRASNLKKISSFTTITKTLHQLDLPVYQNNNKRYIMHHNAVRSFERFYAKRIFLPDDRIPYYGLVNMKERDTSGIIAIKENFAKTNDSISRTGQQLIRIGQGLATYSGILSPYQPLVTGLFKNIFNKPPDFLGGLAEAKSDDSCIHKLISIDLLYWRFTLLEKILKEYRELPAPSLLEIKNEDSSLYFTYAVKASEAELPYNNKYSISYKGVIASSNNYSVGRQQFVTFGAGIFFNSNPIRQTEVDTSGGNFRISNTNYPAKFVIGAKIYPAKAFIPDDGLIPKYPLKRFSVFTGFEITKPLENLYAGFGWDIIPGFQVSAGWHFYRKNLFGVQNNQIIEKSTVYKVSGLYYGFTVDPIILTEILKSLFL